MPSIIIEQAVTNVDILVEPQITTFEVVLTEMQVPGPPGTTDHLLLENIGVNTHEEIDTALTRLADTSGANTGDQDISGKVDKVTGYLLTKNDLTDILKSAYDSAVTWISTNGANLINHLSNIANPHSVTKTQVGLGNVDNTSDANKPVSTAQQTALDLKVNNSLLGAINGVAQLDASGFVKNTQLPSYVDDVLEFTNLAIFPLTGESGKIYIALDTNKTYRWSGTVYAIISETITIGEVKADTEIASAISLKHAQGSDIQDLSGLELLTNKKIDVEANKTSDTFYPSIKSIVDWVTNLFVKGSGTQNYLPKFGVGGKVVGNSQIIDNGTNIGIGVTPEEKLHIENGTLLIKNQGGVMPSIISKATRSGWFSSINIYGGTNIVDATRMQFGQYDNGKMFFFNTGDAPIGFFTNGIEKFLIGANGNITVGTGIAIEKFNVFGNGRFTGSVQVGDNTAVASASNVGATRYRATANNSYLETCMQTSASTYAWVIIKQNTW